ncbi:MAG: ABC transporter ATP-binding protein [Candidatus Sericytochromatia bacterium]
MLLELSDLHLHYGKIHAIKGLNIHIDAGEIVTLIGANGAGKSTTLRAISGLAKPSGGQIRFKGASIMGLTPAQITAQGIVHVPEGRRIFSRLTVLENLEMGAFLIKDKALIKSEMQKVFDYFPILQQRHAQMAGTLSGGEQQMLAIGRGLMSQPQLLILDEPSMGLAPLIVKQIMGIIKTINATGVPIFLVEQNARQALQIAHRGYVLETGQIKLHDQASVLLQEPKVRQAYLGG